MLCIRKKLDLMFVVYLFFSKFRRLKILISLMTKLNIEGKSSEFISIMNIHSGKHSAY